MAEPLSYPGVYLREDARPSLGISAAATAVPLFVFGPFDIWKYTALADRLPEAPSVTAAATISKEAVDETQKRVDARQRVWMLLHDLDMSGTLFRNHGDTLARTLISPGETIFLRVSGWIDYCAQVAPYLLPGKHALTRSLKLHTVKLTGASARGTTHPSREELDTTTHDKNLQAYSSMLTGMGYHAMQHYFNNGGGPCHIALFPATENSNAKRYGELKTYLTSHPEITLFCPVTDKDDAIFSGVMSEPAPRVFSLMAAHDRTNTPSVQTPLHPDQAAAYYPWLRLSAPLLEGVTPSMMYIFESLEGQDGMNLLTQESLSPQGKKDFLALYNERLTRLTPPVLSPVPAVAGAYCRIDNTRGVWKAPANTPLNGVESLCDSSGNPVAMNDDLNKTLMDNRINAIRHFTDQGHLIWGARTLVPVTDLNWRYVPVRRLFNSAENDIREAMQVAVFEPNAPATWEVVRAAIDNYLHKLWQQGALLGATPAEAYFVRVGLNVTMTAEDINNGVMTVKVGLAAVRPAEFIILEFSQKQL